GPHHRVHGQLGAGRPPAQDLPDPGVLPVPQPQLGVRLRLVRRYRGPLDGVGAHRVHPAANAARTEVKNPSPAVPGPVRGPTARSGGGISRTTVPVSFAMPAMSWYEPFGLPPRYRTTTRPSASNLSTVDRSATYPPSPFLIGMTTSAPGRYAEVHTVPADSTRSRWSRQTNRRRSLRISAPGSRCDSHSTWNPLQIPSTGSPPRAPSTTRSITGANRAIAPQRR